MRYTDHTFDRIYGLNFLFKYQFLNAGDTLGSTMGDYDAVETELGKQDFLDDLKVRSSEDSVNRVIDDILGNYLIRNQHSQSFKYFRSRLFSNGHFRLSAPL